MNEGQKENGGVLSKGVGTILSFQWQGKWSPSGLMIWGVDEKGHLVVQWFPPKVRWGGPYCRTPNLQNDFGSNGFRFYGTFMG